ncbi:hypothetical protein CSUI_010788 [Cystoisospora suis]|uniref:Uncharacterized protein n=1 Tax=Cystoisospora suis TaxID=483139 RepID=A0A2C6J977_9APIC|nr:hypothetical protein CSUI_010788 [Cystoisospora suis]
MHIYSRLPFCPEEILLQISLSLRVLSFFVSFFLSFLIIFSLSFSPTVSISFFFLLFLDFFHKTFSLHLCLCGVCTPAVDRYVPQDAAAVGLMYWLGRQHGRSVTTPHKLSVDKETAVQEFLKRKKLTDKQVSVEWNKKSLGFVNLRS